MSFNEQGDTVTIQLENKETHEGGSKVYGENGYVLPIEIIEIILSFTSVKTLLTCMATNRDIAARILAMLKRKKLSVEPFSLCRWCINPAGERLPCICFRDNPNIGWGVNFWKYNVLCAPRRIETARIIRELRDELQEVTNELQLLRTKTK